MLVVFTTYNLLFCKIRGGKTLINNDVKAIEHQVSIKLPIFLQLIYHLHNNRYFRSLFYFRIGPVLNLIISWYRPGDKYFQISATTKIGGGFCLAHPYGTIINADSIGDNFKCIHLTTLGATSKGRPTIGDNVSVGANVTIVGPVKVGDNVVIGAGCVVVRNVPSDCVIAGNPAKIIRYKNA